jgi:hypothetical protein
MKIFTVLKKEEDYHGINYPFTGYRLESRDVSTNQSDVTTSPLDRVTVFLVQYQIIKVFKLNNTRAGKSLHHF